MNATAAPAADVAWSQAARATLAELDAGLARRYDAGEAARTLTLARAQGVDALVTEAWRRCIDDPAIALFAVGGYGRSSLYPQSDVDLLVLVDAAGKRRCGDAVARFIALLWDARVPVSHAVRTLDEVKLSAGEDITVFTALMDARQLAGAGDALKGIQATIALGQVWPARDYFVAKRAELRQRHARFDDTAENLEPNIKEGPGGLRDLQTLRWMALRQLGAADLGALEALGQIGGDEWETLLRAATELQRLRFGLHLVAGKREERLRFDHQRALASRLQGGGEADNAAVEQMMQRFYRSAALVQRVGERLLQRFEEQLDGEGMPEPIDGTFDAVRGYLFARDPAWPHGDPAAVFALFAAWAAHPQLHGLHSRTARALAEALPTVPSHVDAPTVLRSRFLALLDGPDAVRTLERMARLGVLGRWIPAFASVTGRMQFDLFHVYTVDQHTLMLLRNFGVFAEGSDTGRFSVAHEVWQRLRRHDLLLLAGLFHDIAKGRGGDHAELGAEDAHAFCTALGLPPEDVQLVEWLVRHHLLMSVTAQKQDISDPEVVRRFAALVADRDHLDHLYLLTCADIAATSPKLWNAWKDRLLSDLHSATRLALRQGLEHVVAADARIAANRVQVQREVAAQGTDTSAMARLPDESWLRCAPEQLAWIVGALAGVDDGATRVAARALDAGGGALEMMVYSPDRDGLFAAIVATLDRMGLEVQQARLLDAPGGQVIDTFQLLARDLRRAVDPADAEARMRQVLSQPSLDGIRPARRAQPGHLRQFQVAPRIDSSTVDGRTLLSIVCNDRAGLLADIAQVLRAQRLRVHDARIATFGERAEDMFRISREDDRPLEDADADRLRENLHAMLRGDLA